MANIMTMKKLQNKTSRNSFDLSRKNLFTAKIGEILPVACIECIPGDNFKIEMEHFTRTRPVNTAAFTRIREYYDWFFVPTNLLWNKFNTFVTQMGNNNQQAVSANSNAMVGDQHPYFTRNEIITFLQQQNNMDWSKYNLFGYRRIVQSCKLLEYLDYGQWFKGGTYINPQTYLNDVALNPFPLLAYQKIYSDYFRNSQWENSYAPAFNINYLNGNQKIPVSSISMDSPYNMFDLQYANWHKDYFMGLLPNSQYGDAASVNISSLLAENPIVTNVILQNNQAASSTVTTNTVGSLIGANNSSAWGIPNAKVILEGLGLNKNSLIGAFSILALRNAEAMQKWAEITQSQQQDYQSQVDAHFGVKVSDAYSERCTWIGGDDSSVKFQEVTNTNITADNVADIAGKGVGQGQGFCNFETKVHGYLMCVYHAVPLLDYGLNGIPKQQLKTFVTDYAIPEFDKTGMVSVPLIELYQKQYNRDESLGLPEQLGYAPRYYDYKTSYDRVNGAFRHGGFDAWVAPVTSDYLRELLVNSLGGSYENPSLTFEFFKVNPAYMNPIFDRDVDSDLDTDQLLIESYFKIYSVRNLDRDGLPY